MKVFRLAFAVCLLLSFNTFAQITFQKGYVITKEGIRKECFIKNADWLNNPSSIEYRISEEGEVLAGTPETIAEFRVDGFNKYVQADVNIDVSPIRTEEKMDPAWQERSVFLKVLADGPVMLYSYTSREIERRMFFKTEDSPIRQLVYKEYPTGPRQLYKNQKYLGQLRADAWCESFEESELKYLKYAEKPLAQYVQRVNECRGVVQEKDPSTSFTKNQRRKINLSITPGISQASAEFRDHRLPYLNADFPSKTSARLGIEAEFIFGFGGNKWSCFIEPTYESYEAKATRNTVTYSAIELHIGVRHYFYLNNEVSIHVNAGVVPANIYTINNEYNVPYPMPNPHIGWSITGGVGVNYKRFKSEVRYYGERDLLINQPHYGLDVPRVSFVVGYRFLAR